MAEPFPFELVSPERLLISAPVTAVVVPGADGEFTVLKDHSSLMSTLKPGVVVVTPAQGSEQRIFVRGGFADVSPAGLTILAEQAIPVENLRADEIANAIRDAEEDLADAKDDASKATAQTKLDQLREVKAVLGH